MKILERIDRGEATPIDLDVMEDMQKNIIGNCLCVLGDSMAMPIWLDDQALPSRVRIDTWKKRPAGGLPRRWQSEPAIVQVS